MFNRNNWSFDKVVYFVLLTMNVVCMVANGLRGDVGLVMLNGTAAMVMYIALLDERK